MIVSRKTAGSFLGILIGLILALAVFTAYMDAGAAVPETLGDPIQSNLPQIKTIDYAVDQDTFKLDLLAEYKIEAVVKGVKSYHNDGPGSASPMDFILIWGNLNQPDVDKVIHYSQYSRWYHFTVSDIARISVSEVSRHSANTHIIPADEEVLKILKHVKKGDYVSLSGYLVRVYEKDSGDSGIASSLTREDTGAGACEVFYVAKVKIL